MLFQPSTNEDASNNLGQFSDKRSIGVDQSHHPRQRPAFGRDHADQGFLPIHLRAHCTAPEPADFLSTYKLQAFLWPGNLRCGLGSCGGVIVFRVAFRCEPIVTSHTAVNDAHRDCYLGRGSMNFATTPWGTMGKREPQIILRKWGV